MTSKNAMNLKCDESRAPMVLYILGAGHIGSTLLSMALDRNEHIVGVSELVSIQRSQESRSGLADHHFWGDVLKHHKQNFVMDFEETPFNAPSRAEADKIQEWRSENYAALCSIGAVSGARVVADASKQAGRLNALRSIPELNVKVIYLVRDARAITYSYARKYSKSIGMKRLSSSIKAVKNALGPIDPVDKKTIRYEDLTSDFPRVLKDICNFIDVTFDERMLNPSSSDFRGVGGNRMRNSSVRTVSPDEKWRTELSAYDKISIHFRFLKYQSEFGYRML